MDAMTAYLLITVLPTAVIVLVALFFSRPVTPL
jgi:hypothetical protein